MSRSAVLRTEPADVHAVAHPGLTYADGTAYRPGDVVALDTGPGQVMYARQLRSHEHGPSCLLARGTDQRKAACTCLDPWRLVVVPIDGGPGRVVRPRDVRPIALAADVVAQLDAQELERLEALRVPPEFLRDDGRLVVVRLVCGHERTISATLYRMCVKGYGDSPPCPLCRTAPDRLQ